MRTVKYYDRLHIAASVVMTITALTTFAIGAVVIGPDATASDVIKVLILAGLAGAPGLALATWAYNMAHAAAHDARMRRQAWDRWVRSLDEPADRW